MRLLESGDACLMEKKDGPRGAPASFYASPLPPPAGAARDGRGSAGEERRVGWRMTRARADDSRATAIEAQTTRHQGPEQQRRRINAPKGAAVRARLPEDGWRRQAAGGNWRRRPKMLVTRSPCRSFPWGVRGGSRAGGRRDAVSWDAVHACASGAAHCRGYCTAQLVHGAARQSGCPCGVASAPCRAAQLGEAARPSAQRWPRLRVAAARLVQGTAAAGGRRQAAAATWAASSKAGEPLLRAGELAGLGRGARTGVGERGAEGIRTSCQG